jgi:hypothetical protein
LKRSEGVNVAKITKAEVGLVVGLGGVLLALWYLRRPRSEEDGIRVKRSVDFSAEGVVVLETVSGSGFEVDDGGESHGPNGHKTTKKWEEPCFAIHVTGGDCDSNAAFHNAAAVDLVIASGGAEYRSNLRISGKKVRVRGGLWKGGQTLLHPGQLSAVEAFSADGKRTLRCTRGAVSDIKVDLMRCLK